LLKPHSLTESLAADRYLELQRRGANQRQSRRARQRGGTRARVGWYLVDLGLRLATTRSERLRGVTALHG
jgi:hypothetical protein